MNPILEDLTTLASSAELHAPSIPIVSNVHGIVVRHGDASVFTAQYFARHCGEPVKFEQGIHQARLVILQFVRVGDNEFDKELKAACAEILTPLEKTGWKSIPSPQDLGPEYVKIHASMNAGKSQNKRAC